MVTRIAMRRVTALGVWLWVGVWTAGSAGDWSAGIGGRVTDPAGRGIAGVTVTVTRLDTGAARTAVTGGDGAYRCAELAPGHYDLSAEKDGFHPCAVAGLWLRPGERMRLDLAMAPEAAAAFRWRTHPPRPGG